MHELVKNYSVKKKNNTSENNNKTGFVEIESEAKVIGDCRVCKIDYKTGILERNTVEQINDIKKLTQDLTQIQIKIKKQKNWGSVIFAIVIFGIIISIIMFVNTTSINKLKAHINENEDKISLLKQQETDLQNKKTSFLSSNDSLNTQQKQFAVQDKRLTKSKDSLASK